MKSTYRHHHPSASRLERILARLVRVETPYFARSSVSTSFMPTDQSVHRTPEPTCRSRQPERSRPPPSALMGNSHHSSHRRTPCRRRPRALRSAGAPQSRYAVSERDGVRRAPTQHQTASPRTHQENPSTVTTGGESDGTREELADLHQH